MKVSHTSPDMLILDHVPWVIAIGLGFLVLLFVGIGLFSLGASLGAMSWLFSFMFAVVGGGLWLIALEFFARRLQFVFDCKTDRITIRRLSIFGRYEVNHKLSRLKEVRIEQSSGENGQPMARPVLILTSTSGDKSSEQRVPLHAYFTTGGGPDAMCEAINRWLARSSDGIPA